MVLARRILLASTIALAITFSNARVLDSVHMSVKKSSKEDASQIMQMTHPNSNDATTFSFARIFQDHMVLQRAPARASVFGWAPATDIGKKVVVQMKMSLKTLRYEASVSPGPGPNMGMWKVMLGPMVEGVTADIEAQLGVDTLTLDDVIFGDVWICSGQSNMQFTVSQMLGAAEEIADAHNYPEIRLVTVAEKVSDTPLYELVELLQPWSRPDKASVGGLAWTYFSAVCWLYGKNIHKESGIPIGLVASDWGGTPVEAWSSPEALRKCGVKTSTPVVQPESFTRYLSQLPPSQRQSLQAPQDDNSVLWNAMIHPLLNMTIYGAIWYQGEADAGDPVRRNNYNCTFPSMIKDWRLNFNSGSDGQTSELFPFGFVQLAPNADAPTVDVGFPDIRWHQTADWGYVPNRDMPNVFMAVAIDLPDFNSTYGSVHPRDKKDVGMRLSLSGLAVAYGKSEVYQGPLPSHAEMTPGGLKLMYGDQWSLDLRGADGFEVLCTDGTTTSWHAAPIIENDKTTVTVTWQPCGKAENLKGLRYLWRESPCEFQKCAVYASVNNLPAPPFIALLEKGGGLALKSGQPTRF